MKRIIGDIIIILIGLFPLTDIFLSLFGITSYNVGSNFGFNNGSAFLFTFFSTISPILFAIAIRLKPHILFLTLPIFTYSSDLFWIFGNQNKDLDLSRVYGLLTAISFVIISILLNKFLKEEQTKEDKITFLEKLLDLSYAIAKKRNEK